MLLKGRKFQKTVISEYIRRFRISLQVWRDCSYVHLYEWMLLLHLNICLYLIQCLSPKSYNLNWKYIKILKNIFYLNSEGMTLTKIPVLMGLIPLRRWKQLLPSLSLSYRLSNFKTKQTNKKPHKWNYFIWWCILWNK